MVLLICLSSSVFCVKYDKTNHIKLLAVSERSEGNITGATADLFLEIKPGEGRVFIDTFPLTKLDTQISTRFAKEIACDLLNRNKNVFGKIDCNDHDFIYTIKSNAPIIGGPSAGAAISLLTITSLSNLNVDQSVSITGTINSGGFVGVVSGIKHKIDAASEAGIEKVLIPQGTRFYKEKTEEEEVVEKIGKEDEEKSKQENNENKQEEIDLKQYAEEKGVELIEVKDLNEVVFYFTGKQLEKTESELEINEKYLDIMNKVSNSICERSNELLHMLDKEISLEDAEVLKKVDETINKSKKARENQKYYSAASYCFGSNVKLNYLYLKQENLSYQDAIMYAEIISKKLNSLENDIDSINIDTISDLQTYMVVKERIIETKDLIKKVKESEKNYVYNLAFAEERLNSALSWKMFFNSDISEKQLFKDKDSVKKLCSEKLEEAQERTHYLALVLPLDLESIKKEINHAIDDMNNKDYELCLFKALKAKAQANSILNIMNIKEDFINDSIDTKLEIVKRNIIDENNNNMFPLMGYSYYEYANDLKYDDIGSALLYTEYALELSNFHMYLYDIDEKHLFKAFENKEFGVYIVVFLIGLVVGLLYNFNMSKKGPKKARKRK